MNKKTRADWKGIFHYVTKVNKKPSVAKASEGF